VIHIAVSYTSYQKLTTTIADLGPPEYVAPTRCAVSANLFYLKHGIILDSFRRITFDGVECEGRLGFETEVSGFVMTARSFEGYLNSSVNWLGFASMSRYFTPTPHP
jgi:hypothetical protein